jgi:hypothetical protein
MESAVRDTERDDIAAGEESPRRAVEGDDV